MGAQRKDQMRTRQQDKSRQARADAKARKACVEAVWKRAGDVGYGWAHCEVCHRHVSRSSTMASDVGHVHEKLARSLGGNPHDPNQCQLLCVYCHMPNGAHRRSVRTV